MLNYIFFLGYFFGKNKFSFKDKKVYFFFQKNPPKKDVRKTKKVSIKKKFEKNGKNIFSKNKTKLSFLKRAKKVFVFFTKKTIFFSKKGSLKCPFLKTDTFCFAHI